MEKKITIVAAKARPDEVDRKKAQVVKAVLETGADAGVVIEVPESCQEPRSRQAGYDSSYAKSWDAFMKRRTDIVQ